MTHHPPIKARKIVYYRDKALTSRLFAAPEVPALTFEEHKIPKFNLATKKPAATPPPPSPSQIEMSFPEKTEPKLNDLLDDIVAEPVETRDPQGFASAILRALGDE